jgi:hypothetical protein
MELAYLSVVDWTKESHTTKTVCILSDCDTTYELYSVDITKACSVALALPKGQPYTVKGVIGHVSVET